MVLLLLGVGGATKVVAEDVVVIGIGVIDIGIGIMRAM
jgi:hypothetical protein